MLISKNRAQTGAESCAELLSAVLMRPRGYSEHFVQFVAKAREAWPTKQSCAGNGNVGDVRRAILRRRYRKGIGPRPVARTTRVKPALAIRNCRRLSNALTRRMAWAA